MAHDLASEWPAGGGEMGARVRALDWAETPLGPPSGWPHQLRLAVDLVMAMRQPASVCWGADAILIHNDEYRAILGTKDQTALGQPLATVWPELSHVLLPQIAATLRGAPQLWLETPFDLVRSGGRSETGWFTATWTPIPVSPGHIGGFLMVALETTERHRAEQALHDREAQLSLVFETLPVGLAIVDPDGRTVRTNSMMRRYLPSGLIPSQDPMRADRWKAFHSDGVRVRPEDFAAARALRGETVVPGMEMLYTADDGRESWVLVAAAPLGDPSKGRCGAFSLCMDIDDLKRAEGRQALLLHELQHRVRNILSTVRSVVRRTADGTESAEEVRDLLEGRLNALGRTQAMLTRATGAGVDLEMLIREELLAQTADDDRLTVDGPEVVLAPKAAEVITLAIHELASNATTHGAIGQNGRMAVSWRVEIGDDGRTWLHLDWVETGVRVVSGGRRRGFGSELIEDRVPYELGGKGRLTLRPGGVHCEISFPLVPGESVLAALGPQDALEP